MMNKLMLNIFVLLFVCKVFVTAEFDPYADNSGTIVALSGKTFTLLAGDSRLSDNYMIRSRNLCKLFQVLHCKHLIT